MGMESRNPLDKGWMLYNGRKAFGIGIEKEITDHAVAMIATLYVMLNLIAVFENAMPCQTHIFLLGGIY